MSSIHVRGADVHWHDNPPSAGRLNKTRQIRYLIDHDGGSKRSGFADIWAYNTMSRDSYHWRWIPKEYVEPILRLNFRFDLYMNVLDKVTHGRFHKDATVIDDLKRYVAYLENVMDAIWEEIRQADNKNNLSPNWHSRHLDLWLIKEHVIRRHDNGSVARFRAGPDAAALDEDPLELGEFLDVFTRHAVKAGACLKAMDSWACDKIGRSMIPLLRAGTADPNTISR